ncbi:MAG: peptide deformylase [Fidelibacterota bacterium]
MTERKILYASDPKLRQKAKKVKVFGPQLKKLADDMIETMRVANGVGLAGPQIGVMQRIFVAEIPEEEDNPLSGKPWVIINPEITKRTDGMEEGQEGCLSIPGWVGMVDRHVGIEVKARTVAGKSLKLKLTGFLARVFQHEYDHLDGILFVDHITDREKLWQLEQDDDEAYVFDDIEALAA